MRTFTEWLAAQHRREDEIGELAGIVADDRRWPNPKTLKEAHDYLLKQGNATPNIHRLMKAAFAEWERSGKGGNR